MNKEAKCLPARIALYSYEVISFFLKVELEYIRG
jgi:hypothetical protein